MRPRVAFSKAAPPSPRFIALTNILFFKRAVSLAGESTRFRPVIGARFSFSAWRASKHVVGTGGGGQTAQLAGAICWLSVRKA